MKIKKPKNCVSCKNVLLSPNPNIDAWFQPNEKIKIYCNKYLRLVETNVDYGRLDVLQIPNFCSFK